MRNFNPLLVTALLFCMMSMWGCNQQKTGAISTKIRELETRYAKLEEDYRTLQTAQDQQRKRLIQAEAARAALEQEKSDLASRLESTTNDRDGLQKQVSQRTLERDTAQNNLVQFSKDLQALVSKVDTALNNSASPSATIIPASRRTE